MNKSKPKKWIRIVKVGILAILIVVATVYGGVFVGHRFIFQEPHSAIPTIEPLQNEQFSFGVQFQTHAETIGEFVEILANQVHHHYLAASIHNFWPNNQIPQQYIIAESIESGDFWLISPQGEITGLSQSEALAYNISRVNYVDGFSPFEGQGISGIYMALSEADLTNFLRFERYLHVGTYDVFITFAHELFHMVEQPNWAEPEVVGNRNREDFFEDVEARTVRHLLQIQLANALSDANNRNEWIKAAVSTYNHYKSYFSDDHHNTNHWVRIEGTAYYYELISSLFAAYPEQIQTREDFYAAVGLLMTREEIYLAVGAISESYIIGGLASVLLDITEPNPDDWKIELMADGYSTPMSILAQRHEGQSLPDFVPIDLDFQSRVEALIEAEQASSPLPMLFRFFYDILFR
ncbi:MAG: hypothetical protein FWG63_07870 [Defluviitaleaceae bacterium]|nr:hypothetical protein [Defluviitaleaceae bacterium]